MPKSDTFLGIWLYTKCVTFTHDSVYFLSRSKKMKLEIVLASSQNGAKETKMKRLNKKYFSDNRFDEIGADQMIHLDNPLFKNAHLMTLDFS